jgi:RHS repeat-associated protein
VTTAYAYDALGRLLTVDYANDPDVTYTYDLLGRRLTMTDASGAAAWTYLPAVSSPVAQPQALQAGDPATGQPATADGPFDSDTLAYTWDAAGRRLSTALDGSAVATYTYDTLGRLATVAAGTAERPLGPFSYSYLAASTQVTSLAMPGGVTTTRTYDSLGRLATVSSGTAERLLGSFSYTVDNHDRRTRVDLADGGRWEYTYDAAGQLVGGVRYGPRWPDATEQVLATYGYQYDPMGNPTQRSEDAGVSAYTYNNLNQLVTGSWSGSLSAFGWAQTEGLASLTVDAQPATVFQQGQWTAKGLTVPAGDTTLSVVRTAQDQTQATAEATVTRPADATQFSHDLNGNMLALDGWTLTWDDENRLVAAVKSGSAKLEYVYDGLGRRRIRRLFAFVVEPLGGPGSWQLQSETHFLWDSWLLLREVTVTPADGQTFTRTYVCGLDLSGQLGGEGMDPMSTAGGIGGILACSSSSSSSSSSLSSTALFLYDGNGNVANLIAAESASTLATYEYGPFGNTLVASGPLADANPIRFSTKYAETAHLPGSFAGPDLYYYGLRYYNPGLGRWTSRDPIGEQGGAALHRFVRNDPAERWDGIGLAPSCCELKPAEQLAASTTAGRYRVCCYETGLVFRHCHVQYAPCKRLSATGMPITEYPVALRTDGYLDNGIPCRCATASDITACAGTMNAPEDPVLPGMRLGRQVNCAGWLPGRNCQTCTRDILGKCCLKSPWRISWYAGGNRGPCVRWTWFVPPGSPAPVCEEYELDKYLGLVEWR